MQIGIDATALPPDPVGAGNYIIQLIRALVALETEHQLVIFAQPGGRKLIGELPPQRARWITVPNLSPAVRLVWEQTLLPVLVKQSRVDLLHSLHYTSPLALPCPSVVTFHDMTFFLFPELHTHSKRLFFPLAIRQSARRAAALIAVSESTRRDTIRILGVDPERIFTTPLGISQDFHPIAGETIVSPKLVSPESSFANISRLEEGRRQFHLPEHFILYVGLIEPRKNVPLLIQAYARLTDTEKVPPLVLVGRPGWMYEQVFQLVEQLKLKDRVIFQGYVSPQNLPIVYNLAQFFVYPSTYEGFGFPPLEAMACGTPVITTAVSAMLDNVGEAGLLIPPRDVDALSQAMQMLLESNALRIQLSQAGRQRAAEFTWQRTAMETMKVYQMVGKRTSVSPFAGENS